MNDLAKIPKKAVALSYDSISAPVLSAKGAGEFAEEIIAMAKKYGVPIREEPELVGLLARLKLGEEIPRELYIAVAETLAFAYMIKGKVPHQA